MSFDALWPEAFRPQGTIVWVGGPISSGKTLFMLGTGASPERTLFIDSEGSAAIYAPQIPNLHYINAIKEWGDGSDTEFFKQARQYLRNVQAGQYDVIALDNWQRYETGHAEYVSQHPQEYGLSAGQIQKMAGLMWGKVKSEYQSDLLGFASKTKMLLVAMHLSEVYKNNRPTGVYKIRGKDTLDIITSLKLWLKRVPGQGPPVGLVLKDRYSLIEYRQGQGLVPTPVLPYRIPVCTWEKIRVYMNNPADRNNPQPDEVPSPDEWAIMSGSLTEEARLILKAAMAAAKETEDSDRTKKERLVVDMSNEFPQVFSSASHIARALQVLGLRYTGAQDEQIRQALREYASGNQD